MDVDTTKWSGEGEFTQKLVDRLRGIDTISVIRVEDAPASRAEADYNFISNEIYVHFATRVDKATRFGIFAKKIIQPAMTVGGLEQILTADPDIGAADYSDEAMLQYLRTERIIPPYQTRGYKLVELVRIYRS
jgi:hypothetical protein